jgi:cytochrome c
MSGIELNKIFGAIILAMLIAMVAGAISRGLVPTGNHGEERVVAFAAPEVEGSGAAEAEVEAEPAIETLLASADVGSGEKIFKKCAACHTNEKGGANKVGPALWGIVGQDIAAVDGFAYSDALNGKEGAWTYEALSGFLKRPRDWAPGTKMGFAGLKKVDDRADIIVYLRSLSDNPVALPQ